MILERILESKRSEVAHLKQVKSIDRLKGAVGNLPPPLDFKGAISRASCSIIAEVKRKSPSRGRIREDFDPIEIATLYQKNGAAAISVLTDERFFEGRGEHLSGIRKVVDIPLLRKDFIIDPYQLYETRILGGDALLLIVRLLEEAQLREYIGLTESVGLSSLVEVHNRGELDKALASGARIIGINNRDLMTFSTDLGITLDLVTSIPEDRVVVSESGISTREDIERLMRAGIRTFLVGEALMRAEDMGEKLRELLGTVE
jgi:indole-3-glycerol phosphate synthase